MSRFDSLLNALVMILLCAAGYFICARSPRTAPPDDPWFRSAVTDRQEPVLVKFGAEWCGPCRMMEPVLNQFESGSQGRMAVVRVDVSKHPQLAQHYGVSAIPRLLLFRDGQVVADRVGYADAAQLHQWVKSYAKQLFAPPARSAAAGI